MVARLGGSPASTQCSPPALLTSARLWPAGAQPTLSSGPTRSESDEAGPAPSRPTNQNCGHRQSPHTPPGIVLRDSAVLSCLAGLGPPGGKLGVAALHQEKLPVRGEREAGPGEGGENRVGHQYRLHPCTNLNQRI